MLDPVAHEEVERRLADREERVYKVVHLRAALENEKGNDRHAANEEKIEPDEVEIEDPPSWPSPVFSRWGASGESRYICIRNNKRLPSARSRAS